MTHASYNKAVRKPVDLPTVVRSYRSATKSLRRRSQVTPTRNGGANERALQRHNREVAKAELALILSDHYALAGELNEEAGLLARLAEAHRHGIERPELQTRLRLTRARIRKLAGM